MPKRCVVLLDAQALEVRSKSESECCFLLLEKTLELSNPVTLKLQLYMNYLGCLLERQILGSTLTKFQVRVKPGICFFNKYTQVF